MKLKTSRLILRPLTSEDALPLIRLRSDERVNRYIQRPRAMTAEEADAFIAKITDGAKQRKLVYWAIQLKDQPHLIGTICLWNFSKDRMVAEIGYELHPDHQGQGLMGEAIEKVLECAFEELDLQRLEAFTHRENEPSIQLLLRYGFALSPGRKDKAHPGNVVFSLVESDWEKGQTS